MYAMSGHLGDKQMKKKWQKPELIVLYRGKPDESLMQVTPCKGGAAHRNQPDNAAGNICAFDHGGRIGQLCYTYSPS